MKFKIIGKKAKFLANITVIFLAIILVFLFYKISKQYSDNSYHSKGIGYPSSDHFNFDFTSEQFKESYINETLRKYKNKKVICLTFDDGPSKYTSDLLDILNEYDIHATFFLLGNKIASKKNVVKRMMEANHTIGIHGYSHNLFTRLTNEQIDEEIQNCISELKEITNTSPIFIRIPYGIGNENITDKLKSYNLAPVLWHIDSKDWKLKNKNKIANLVVRKAKDRHIILMHDTYKFSVSAVPLIYEGLKDEYSFISLIELSILNKYDKK